MIEDLKKLLPREKEIGKLESYVPTEINAYNSCLAEVTACLPSLVEYIYADLREKIAKLRIPIDKKFCASVCPCCIFHLFCSSRFPFLSNCLFNSKIIFSKSSVIADLFKIIVNLSSSLRREMISDLISIF
jgi:hypothetical protein